MFSGDIFGKNERTTNIPSIRDTLSMFVKGNVLPDEDLDNQLFGLYTFPPNQGAAVEQNRELKLPFEGSQKFATTSLQNFQTKQTNTPKNPFDEIMPKPKPSESMSLESSKNPFAEDRTLKHQTSSPVIKSLNPFDPPDYSSKKSNSVRLKKQLNPFDPPNSARSIKSSNPFDPQEIQSENVMRVGSAEPDSSDDENENESAIDRFIQRRFGVNSEEFEDDNLPFSKPRSESAIMADLDSCFYTADFDPVIYMLKNLPEDCPDYVAYLDKEMSEKDVALRFVLAQLSTKVQEHSSDLVGGMKFVQQVDYQLAQASIQIANTRRKLKRAQTDLVKSLLQIVRQRHQRDQVYKVLVVAKQVRAVLGVEKYVTGYINSGDFSAAVEAAADARHAAEDGDMADILLLSKMRERLDEMLPRIAQRTDSVLGEIFSQTANSECVFEFEPAVYEAIVQAYMVLDDHGLSAGSIHQVGHRPSGGLAGVAGMIQWFVCQEAESALMKHLKRALVTSSTKVTAGYVPSLEDLCGLVPSAHLVEISLGFCEACASLLHLYYMLMQWHRCPFTEQSNSLPFLHRCRIDETESFSKHTTLASPDYQKQPSEVFEENEDDLDSTNEDLAQALEDAALLKERRRQLDRERLEVVFHALRQGRLAVWERIQSRAVTLLICQNLALNPINIEDLAGLMSIFQLLIAFGREFASTREEAALTSSLQLKCRQCLAALNEEAIDTLKQRLDSESWGRVPIRIEGRGHAALLVVLASFRRDFTWQAFYNTWSSFSSILKNHKQGASLLMQWCNAGNPFQTVSGSESTAEFKCASPRGYRPALIDYMDKSYAEVSQYDTEEEQIAAEMRCFGSCWVITQAALQGVCSYLGRYLQIMEIAPVIASETFQIMCQLVDFYLFVVFTLFVPEERIAALLGHGSGPPLLGCEEEEFAQLRAFVVRAASSVAATEKEKAASGRGYIASTKAQRRLSSPLRSPGSAFGRHSNKSSPVPGNSGGEANSTEKNVELPEYVVAVESCFFVVANLMASLPQVLEKLPEEQRNRCEKTVNDTQQAVLQLKKYIYRSIAPYLVDRTGIIQTIQQQDWLKRKIQNHENPYVNDIIKCCEDLWNALQTGVRSDFSMIAWRTREELWVEAVQSIMFSLVEGFSLVKKCSTEGRALMSMDLQALQLGLDEIKRARPTLGRIYVDSYIKAFYYGDSDLVKWIEDNRSVYSMSQMINLASCGTAGKIRGRKIKEILAQVELFYPQANTSEHNTTLR